MRCVCLGSGRWQKRASGNRSRMTNAGKQAWWLCAVPEARDDRRSMVFGSNGSCASEGRRRGLTERKEAARASVGCA